MLSLECTVAKNGAATALCCSNQLLLAQLRRTATGCRYLSCSCRPALAGTSKSSLGGKAPQSTQQAGHRSQVGRTVCRKAQMMELITSCSCCGDIANSVGKQWFVIARSSAKKCSRCSG